MHKYLLYAVVFFLLLTLGTKCEGVSRFTSASSRSGKLGKRVMPPLKNMLLTISFRMSTLQSYCEREQSTKLSRSVR